MAINFPNSPVNGSTYNYQGITYTYSKNGTDEGYWRVTTPGTLGVASTNDIDAELDTIKYLTPLQLATAALWVKLKGIETNATQDQTAAQLLASLKTVDVNGSAGLNAGTLNGLGSSADPYVNTVALRDGAGDLTCRIVRPEYAGLSAAANVNYITTQIQVGAGTDNYQRPATPEQVRLAMGGSLGVGMTWKNVTRVANTTYTNNTGYPMYVGVLSSQISANETYLLVNGVRAGHFSVQYVVSTGYVGAVVPAGNTYIWVGSNHLSGWTELSV
tara:strand:- start:11920 stop:12738 length:819 start_codon:yes stop_codon:yes gene_type:complete